MAGDHTLPLLRLIYVQADDSDPCSFMHETCLHLGAKHKHVEVVRFLLAEAKANPNIPDVDGNTPLHLAVRNCFEYAGHVNEAERTIVELLVTAKANVMQLNDSKVHPLALASQVYE